MALVPVCAWCDRFLGFRDAAESSDVSHGICRAWAARQDWTEPPSLVVSRARQEMLPAFRDLLRGTPEVPIVVDRRTAERRASNGGETLAPERREGRDRLQGASLMLA